MLYNLISLGVHILAYLYYSNLGVNFNDSNLVFKSLCVSLIPLGIIEKKEFCSLGFCTQVWVL